jgi:hypothetical protein
MSLYWSDLYFIERALESVRGSSRPQWLNLKTANVKCCFPLRVPSVTTQILINLLQSQPKNRFLIRALIISSGSIELQTLSAVRCPPHNSVAAISSTRLYFFMCQADLIISKLYNCDLEMIKSAWHIKKYNRVLEMSATELCGGHLTADNVCSSMDPELMIRALIRKRCIAPWRREGEGMI